MDLNYNNLYSQNDEDEIPMGDPGDTTETEEEELGGVKDDDDDEEAWPSEGE